MDSTSKGTAVRQERSSRTTSNHAQEERGEGTTLTHSAAQEPLRVSIAQLASFEEGCIIPGCVVRVTKNEVFVDVGYKSEGIISIQEFYDLCGKPAVQEGDEIKVVLLRRETSEGFMVLSKRQADERRGWQTLEEAVERRQVLVGQIIKAIRGGWLMQVAGITAFMPRSQYLVKAAGPAPQVSQALRATEAPRESSMEMEARPGSGAAEAATDGAEAVGREVSVRVMKVNRLKNQAVVSHRLHRLEEKSARRSEVWQHLSEGQVVRGVVKTIVSYGAFVDVGGVDGLLHIHDMSWGRLGSPEKVVQVGHTIDVVVLKIDRQANKIALGLKQLTEDPWTHVAAQYPAGKIVTGKVVNVVDYGAFVKLEEGVEGLVHISEMSWTKRPKHPSQLLAIGDHIEVVVLNADPENRRLSLGIKQLEPDPWTSVGERYRLGDRVKGTVRTLTDFGVFVELSDEVEGLLHLSDLSWVKRLAHPSEVFKRGDKIEVVVLKVDPDQKRLALGYKQLTPDPWPEEIPVKFPVGQTFKGRVSRLASFGAFVELEGGVDGFVHQSDPSLHLQLGGRPLEEVLSVGTVCQVVVAKVDAVGRRIGLGLVEILQ